jgi:hypothetical protein
VEENRRLEVIENKIDRLSEVVISMARVEEKIANIEENQQQFLEKIYAGESKVTALEKRVDSNEITTKVIERIFWIGITALVGAYLVNVFVT